MLNHPKRQRIINLPKGVSRAGFLSQRNNSKRSSDSLNSAHLQFSFNLNQHQQTHEHLNVTNEFLVDASPKRTLDNLYTINPQKTKSKAQTATNHHGLGSGNSPRRQHIINHISFKTPIVQDSQNQELIEKQQNPQQNSYFTNIRTSNNTQKPLEQQTKSQIQKIDPPKKLSPMQKIQRSDIIFNQYKRQQSLSFYRDKSKILPNLSKMGASQPEDMLKLVKKHSELEFYNTNLQAIKDKFEKKRSMVEYGHLLPLNKVAKLKQQINQIVSDKKKTKLKIKPPNQSRVDDNFQIEERKNYSSNLFIPERTKKLDSNLNNNLEEGYGYYQQNDNQIETQRKDNYRSFSTPKQLNPAKRKSITVSYKTSLGQLKQIYKTISNSKIGQIQVLVPKVLMTTYFEPGLDKNELYNHSKYLFTCLGIPATGLTIKKYSNCILMVSKNICILWHYDGKVYLGGWQFKYLDEGARHGMGLEWVPNKYVYYGEYSQSKKSGLGILKTTTETFIGEWIQGKKTDNGCVINRSGEIFHPRLSFDVGNKLTPFEGSNLESDPFM